MGAKRQATVRLRTDAFNPTAGTFSAYVSVYDVEYEVGSFFAWREKISPGAFDASIRDRPIVPVFYEHKWDAGPLGSASMSSDSRGLRADGGLYLDLGSDLVSRVHRGMADGALNEWSIAFYVDEDGIEWTRDNPDLDVITRGDLAEATICVRGANPATETLTLDSTRPRIRIVGPDVEAEVARARSAHELRLRGAVGSHSTATSDSSWDGPGAEAKIDAADLPGVGPKEWAWRDSSSDGKSKADWKFPHHFVGDGGTPGAASTVACSSIIASLNGGRGGSSIPDGDRSGVYAHAKKHLADSGAKDIPELKSGGPPRRRQDPAGALDPGDNPQADQLANQIEDLLDQFVSVADAQDAQDLLSVIHDAEEELMQKVASPDAGGASMDSASQARLLAMLHGPNPALRGYAREALSSAGPA